MKLVIAIISNDDSTKVLSAVSREGFSSTKISTAGQFLADGHTTILIGTSEDKIESLFDIIKNNVTKRTVTMHDVGSTIEGSLIKKPVDVEKNGAVAFVIDVEDFRKL